MRTDNMKVLTVEVASDRKGYIYYTAYYIDRIDRQYNKIGSAVGSCLGCVRDLLYGRTQSTLRHMSLQDPSPAEMKRNKVCEMRRPKSVNMS